MNPTAQYLIRSYRSGKWSEHRDEVTVEEPLEIHVVGSTPKADKVLATTMRTPGHDDELAAGFLFSEGLIHQDTDIEKILQPSESVVQVFVSKKLFEKIQKSESLNRYSFVNSSCGVCGRTSIEDLRAKGFKQVETLESITPKVVVELVEEMKRAQKIFHHTGGLHAAGLFDFKGEPCCVREDVGRHNAVDKILGESLLRNVMPLGKNILMVSGRLSYEIVQKAVSAQIPIVAAVSAPSSLAIKVAHEFNISLIGFLRGDQFNVYTGHERLTHLPKK